MVRIACGAYVHRTYDKFVSSTYAGHVLCTYGRYVSDTYGKHLTCTYGTHSTSRFIRTFKSLVPYVRCGPNVYVLRTYVKTLCPLGDFLDFLETEKLTATVFAFS